MQGVGPPMVGLEGTATLSAGGGRQREADRPKSALSRAPQKPKTTNATTADRAEVKTPQEFQQLILSPLEDRFQLKFHREQKEGPVYGLELDKPGKLGPALKLSPPPNRSPT